MSNIENNANCTTYSESKYIELVQWAKTMPVPKPINPLPTKITLEAGGIPSTPDRMIVQLGTALIAPPRYESAEYIGPFQQTFDVALSNQYQEWPIWFSPSIFIFYDKARAICTWESEEGKKIPKNSQHPHFRIELLPYRKNDVMSSYNIERVD